MIDVPREDIIVMLEAGYIYQAMKKFKEARAVFEGICELAPKHDVPQVALSGVYFMQGKYLEAIRILKNTIKDNPNSAFAYAYLGESQLFYGKKQEALESLKKSSSIEPDAKGKSGVFARSLIDLINMGYDPVELRKAYKKTSSDAKKHSEEVRQPNK